MGAAQREGSPDMKRMRRPTFIRAWRKYRELTLAELSKSLADEGRLEISESQLSRTERGETPYNQDLLEAVARALQVEPADLIARSPPDPAKACRK